MLPRMKFRAAGHVLRSRVRKGSTAVVAVVIPVLFIAAGASAAITHAPTATASLGGVTLYNGNPVDASEPQALVTLRASELSGASDTWEISTLYPFKFYAPPGKGVWVLSRIDPATGALEGGVPQRGINYGLVYQYYAPFATSTAYLSFSLPPLGGLDAASGTYRLQYVTFPQTIGHTIASYPYYNASSTPHSERYIDWSALFYQPIGKLPEGPVQSITVLGHVDQSKYFGTGVTIALAAFTDATYTTRDGVHDCSFVSYRSNDNNYSPLFNGFITTHRPDLRYPPCEASPDSYYMLVFGGSDSWAYNFYFYGDNIPQNPPYTYDEWENPTYGQPHDWHTGVEDPRMTNFYYVISSDLNPAPPVLAISTDGNKTFSTTPPLSDALYQPPQNRIGTPYTESDLIAWLADPEQGIPPAQFLPPFTFEYVNDLAPTHCTPGVDENCNSNVLFLPGFQGSVLKMGDDKLWPPTLYQLDQDLAKLRLQPDGSSLSGIVTAGVTNTFYTFPVYRDFTSFMDGIATGTDALINEWLPLAYDWRFAPERILEDGIATDAGIVDVVSRVEEFAARSRTGKVTIVAHSNGGLLGKALIKKLEDEGKGDLIDAFVLVASPQLGTPKAVAGLLHGEGQDIAWKIFTFVNKADARKLGYDLESAYDLLPSRAYFDAVIDPPVILDSLTPFTKPWRDEWGFVLNTPEELTAFMTGQAVARERPAEDDTATPEVLRPELVAAADGFHETYDDYEIPTHIRVVQIAGWGLPTIKNVEYTEIHGNLAYVVDTTVEGDGTVVYPSATMNDSETLFVNLDTYTGPGRTQYEHINILSALPVQDVIRYVIHGTDIEESDYLHRDKPTPLDGADKLLVRTHSPVLLGVTDEVGNFTGIDPAQDPATGVLFTSQGIPGSTFFTFGESQYAYLPREGTYSFVLAGTGEGPTTVEIASVTGDTTVEISSFTDIPTTQNTSIEFSVASDTPETVIMAVDSDGDGSSDALYAPDGASPSLDSLLALLKEKVGHLSANDSLIHKLLDRIARIEKKIDKKEGKNATILANLKKKLGKQAEKGKIDALDAGEIITLVEQLEAMVSSLPLNAVLLDELKSGTLTLDIKQGLKRDLLRRVERLETVQGISRSLSNLANGITRKAIHGRLNDAEAQQILQLLSQLESAI